jgi:hypothetical protein
MDCQKIELGLARRPAGSKRFALLACEKNARFLRETLGNMTAHYSRLTYIAMPYDAGLGFEAEARLAAAEKGWEFDRLEGDLGLLARLVNGQWGDDMAVVQPGQTLAPTHDQHVLCARCQARPG